MFSRRGFGPVLRRPCVGAVLAALGLVCGAEGRSAEVRAAGGEKLPPDLRLVPADAHGFVSVRLGEVRASPLGKLLPAAVPPGELLVPAERVERFTLVLRAPDAPVLIVRAARPYKRADVLRAFSPSATEVTFRKRAYYLARPLPPKAAVERVRPDAVYLLDGQTILRGPLPALADFLARGARSPAEGSLADALALAGKHHAVLWGRPAEALKALKLSDDVLDEWWALLADPFLHARVVRATLDLGDEVKLDLRSEHADEQGARDAQTVVRAGLYVARQVLRRLPDVVGLEPASAGKLSATVRKADAALRSASVVQRKATLTASLRFTPNAADLAALAAEAEKAAERTRHVNDLRQIALALVNYADTYGALPGPAIYDKAGKPLLSWRVALLPFIEEGALYKEFKLDEPWDSEHNKKLLAKMPKVYAPRAGTTKLAHGTFYRVFSGPDTPFDPAATRRGPLSLCTRYPAGFPDGTSNTLLVVEASEAVPWTRPDELPYDPKKAVPKLGGQFPGTFLAAFADASVRVIRSTIDEKTLRLLIDPKDGMPIDWDKVPELGKRTRRGRGAEGAGEGSKGVKGPPGKRE
jgi:hypothetical protein